MKEISCAGICHLYLVTLLIQETHNGGRCLMSVSIYVLKPSALSKMPGHSVTLKTKLGLCSRLTPFEDLSTRYNQQKCTIAGPWHFSEDPWRRVGGFSAWKQLFMWAANKSRDDRGPHHAQLQICSTGFSWAINDLLWPSSISKLSGRSLELYCDTTYVYCDQKKWAAYNYLSWRI